MYKSHSPNVHVVEPSQHINVPAGPAKNIRAPSVFLKKGRSTYLQPRVVLTRKSPLIVHQTITSLERPKIKKVYTEKISRCEGIPRVIDVKERREYGRESEIVAESAFQSSLDHVRPCAHNHHHNHGAALELVQSNGYNSEIDIVNRGRYPSEIDIVNRGCGCGGHRDRDILVNEDRLYNDGDRLIGERLSEHEPVLDREVY